MSREPGAGAGRGADDVNMRCRELLRIIHDHVSKHYPDLDPDDVAQETLVRFLSKPRRLGSIESMGAVRAERNSDISRR